MGDRTERTQMSAYLCTAYLMIGLIVAGFVFVVFKPTPGYRPGFLILVLAGLIHILLWPVMGVLGISYLIGCYFNRPNFDDLSRVDSMRRFRQRILFDKTYLRN